MEPRTLNPLLEINMEKEQSQLLFGFKDHKLEACMSPMEVDPSNHEIKKKLVVSNGRELVASESDEILEPCEGMEFDSEAAARTFYSAYARHIGFCTRISKFSRSRRDNSVISRQFVCSKEGFRDVRVKKDALGKHRQQQRAVTRVGCKAMIMVKKLGSGKWVVTRFTKEHNHCQLSPKKVELMVTCEVNDSKVKSLVSEEDMVWEPFEGMAFESEEAVRTFYSIYAMYMGFRARVSKYCRSRRDNSVISRLFVCSKEGFREVCTIKDIVNEGKVRRPRVITRIGCKAMIAVKKLTSGNWVVTKFVKEHNHALGTSKNLVHLRSDISTRKYLALPAGVVTGGCSEMQSVPQDSPAVLYNQLCYEALRYAQEGAVSDEIYNVAMTALKEAVEKVTAAKRSAVTATQTSHHKVDTVKLDPAKSISQVNRSKTSHPGLSDAAVVAIPALPVAPCTPAKGSVPATCSVTESSPLKSPYTLVTTPIGLSLDSAYNADAFTQSIVAHQPEPAIHASATSLATSSGSVSGPNPQVHATALALGARILPPKAAASLIKAVESRIRSPDASLTISVHADNNTKQLTTLHRKFRN
ncbi:putative transcription factor FAR family [Dioscorea sansibarensis]